MGWCWPTWSSPTLQGDLNTLYGLYETITCNAKKTRCCNPWISFGKIFFQIQQKSGGCWCFFFIHKKSWKHNLNVPSTCQKESSNPWGFYPNHHTGNKLSPCLKGKEKTHDIFLESPNQNIWQVSRLTCSMCFSNCFKEHSLRCSKSILLFPGFEFSRL